VLLGINFRQWLRHIKVNVVQIQLPLFDPAPHLDTRVAFLPSLGPGIEFVTGRFGDAAGKGASVFQYGIVVVLSFDHRPGKRLDRLIERGDGGVQRLGFLANVSRQSIAFGQLLFIEFESSGLSFHAHSDGVAR
jgi:hypothetical protein